MTIEGKPETTLREEISAVVDAVETRDTAGTAAPDKVKEAPQKEAAAAPEKAEEQPKGAGRTAGRARDENGRLLPGKAEKPE